MRTPRPLPACLAACLLAILSLVPLPARAAGYIRVTVAPTVLLADGISTATVTAEVRGGSGRPARDGTEVRFYTTAGTITQAAFTSSGIARATLTSSSFPQSANVSVSVGLDQAVLSVPMVSKLVEANVGGRVLKVTGKYVAFSEDKHFIQADEQVKVRFRGVDVEANSVQIDLNQDRMVALGKVNIASGEKTLVGERLWLDLKSFEGYMVAVKLKQWFSAYDLTELPEKPKNANATFELEDLSDSKLLWVSKQANYVVGERVQVQGARAYVGGIKSVRMPFHESSLQSGFNESNQYIGLGSQGIDLDLPLYVRMSPNASTAFRVGYGTRSGGIGNFTRQAGLSVDLVQKYGFAGASEGQAFLTNMNDFNRWGFLWNHTQKLGRTSRLVTNLQFPQHRDFYGSLNLTSGLPVGTVQLGLAAQKARLGTLGSTLSLGYETKPKPLAGGKVALTGETTYFRRDQASTRLAPGVRTALTNTQYQTVGARLRPRPVSLMKGLSLDSSLALRAVNGTGSTRSGFGPALETQIRKSLANNGMVALGFTYNHLASINDFLPSQGKMNATLNAGLPITKKLRISALGSMALDAPSRNVVGQLSYQMAPKWRLDLLHTMFQYGGLGDFDYQFGVARELGGREMGVYWSRRRHRWLFQFGAARF